MNVRIASGVVCAGGCLGILIPPSILLIVYAAMAGMSVVQLYAAAILPGFFLAALYIIYVVVLATIKPQLMPPLPKDQYVPAREVVVALMKSFVPLALLILAVLGSIMFGLATPTEAAAVGALGSRVLAAAYRALTWGRLKESVYLTARTSAMVCFLFVGSATFAGVFGYLGGQAVIEKFVLSLDMNPVMFLIVAQLIIFLLGWPLEWTEIIIIFVPIFLPILQHFNIDPILWGVLVFVNLQAAFLSPPVAMSAFYLKGVAPPHVTINQIFAGMMPYMLIVILCMVILYLWPGMALWLPEYLYGS
jgi:tripartite ATP-independent transporter DctM subunit